MEEHGDATIELKAGRRHSAADLALIADIKSSASNIITAANDLGADEPGAEGEGDMGKSAKARDAITKKEGDQSCTADCYLVVEDEFKPDTWHLRVKDEDGTPNHNLMGAAWASLHGGYRGQKYEGPDKDKAVAKLKKLYEAEDMPLPSEKSTRADAPTAKSARDGGRSTQVVVKAKTTDTVVLGGYGVVFGGQDLVGDTFDKSTNFWLGEMSGPRPVLYEHGLDDRIDLAVLGKTVKMEVDDWGLWVEAEIERHREYVKEVEQLAEAGVLGWSSGSAGHMVRREVGGGKSLIKSWPILEFSLTPTPAEPRTLGVKEVRAMRRAVKALAEKQDGKAVTLEEQSDAAEEAIEAALRLAFPESAWAMTDAERVDAMFMGEDCEEPALYIYPDAAVAQVGIAYWQIPYTIEGAQVSVADRSQWQMVDLNWQPAPTRSVAAHKEEEEIEMTPEELKAMLAEVASTVAVQAATAASEATATKMREMFEDAPPVKTVGVAAPNVVTRGKDEPEMDELKAFRLWMAYGNEAPRAARKVMRKRYTPKPLGMDMTGDEDETKATLGEGSAPGSYWVPTGLANQIILPLANTSYLRKAGANVVSDMVGYDPFNLPALTFSGRATIGGESSLYVPDEPTGSQIQFVPWKLKKMAKATEEMVEDSRYDVWRMILQPDWEQSFAEGENYYFTLGTGSGQPQGVVTGATTGVTAASQTTFTADEMIALFYSVDPKYRDDASFAWMANDAVLKVIRQFKDGKGEYLWTPGFGGTPDRLVGKPVIWNNSMTSTLASGAAVLVAGAFRYYTISDWPGVQVQRLNELFAETGHVGFRGFRRVDGHIMQAAAFRKLVLG